MVYMIVQRQVTLHCVKCNILHVWVLWIHQIHAAEEVGSSTTMVVVIVVCLCCVLQSRLVVVTRCM